ncbi:alpha/beta hydrolase [Vannielia litorea]|uniref:alpha/beta hydrolase n=1 Tax=Vannielia litorea TaxID=1217970 RepID=UPI001C9631D3|nr:alpha/beta hydrolase [Vannielia litorea]MBY6048917.1 alpha/beta hydrolase [Vannielia litorea]MBY6076331.1 alpha/beta hydrolase [Vannielia litorea]
MSYAEGIAEVIALGDFPSPEEAAAYWNEGVPEAPFEDLCYTGGGGQSQRARLYRGGGAGTLLYIHGGGWAGGSIELHQPSAAGMALQSGWDVLSISYRLAPAHPFPAGLEDCRAALDFLAAKGGKLAIGGASAGANLALATALSTDVPLAGMVLFYGVYGDDFETESYRRHEAGPGLTRTRMQELFAMYDPGQSRDPLIAPLKADLHGLPPALLIAAEVDVLRSENEAMADALQNAGVPTTWHVEPGVTHGFINRGRLVPAAEACITRAAHFLKETLT